MSEIAKIYSDSFEVIGTVYGLTLKFQRRPAVAVTAPPPPEVLAEVSMSWEHAKAMVFILWRYIKEVEVSSGVSYPIPARVLSDMRISPEDWQTFWKAPA